MTNENTKTKTVQEELAERDKPENIHRWLEKQKGQPTKDVHEWIHQQKQAEKIEMEKNKNESTKIN